MEYMLMPLRRYADFSGRSRRMEYWMFVLGQVVVYIIAGVLLFGIFGSALMSSGQNVPASAGLGFVAVALFLLLALFWLVLLVPNLAVTVRRLHDTNRSGWWFGIYFLANIALNMVSGTLALAATSQGSLMAVTGLMGILGLGMLVYAIVLLVFFFLDGTPGPNRYGQDPKGRADAANVFA